MFKFDEQFTVPIQADENGFWDRECPQCLYTFKISLKDWKEKVSDEVVYCPMCGHQAPPKSWFTKKQLTQIRKNTTNFVIKQLHESFKQIARETPSNGSVKITVPDIPSSQLIYKNPIKQTDEWEIENVCNQCGTRYSVRGLAPFCPCCGHSEIHSLFLKSLDAIDSSVNKIPYLRESLNNSIGEEQATSNSQLIVEGLFTKVTSLLQKNLHSLFEDKTQKKARLNDFQIIDKAAELFKNHLNIQFDTFLNEKELQKLNLFFQRRHLLEHNMGIVDEKYIQNTNDTEYKVGQHIIITEKDIVSLSTISRKLACEIFKAK